MGILSRLVLPIITQLVGLSIEKHKILCFLTKISQCGNGFYNFRSTGSLWLNSVSLYFFRFCTWGLVVKTTNLETQTRMDTAFKPQHLLIYKGKTSIGSFSCRNDCLTVHFNWKKRPDSGVSRDFHGLTVEYQIFTFARALLNYCQQTVPGFRLYIGLAICLPLMRCKQAGDAVQAVP